VTTIIAIETDEGLTFGWDSQITAGWHIYEGEMPKVFTNNGIIFGVAGAVLDASVIRQANLPSPDDAGWDIDKWVTNKLVPALTDALSKRGALTTTSGKIETDSHLLIGVRGRLYKVGGDLNVLRRADRTYVVGSGCEFARGALSAGATILKALEIAAQHDMATGGTLHVHTEKELVAA